MDDLDIYLSIILKEVEFNNFMEEYRKIIKKRKKNKIKERKIIKN